MVEGRGIDHLVLVTEDLDEASAFYRTLGFTTTPRAVHPFGTGNALVQLQGNFIELVGIVDPGAIATAEPGGFSFAAFCRDRLREAEGMCMLVLESRDARADHAAFTSRGLRTHPPMDFQRLARLPDGSEVTVGFSLAFVTDPRLPRVAFFVCQQHAPQHFWKAEYQTHANGAQVVDRVYMVAEDPPALADLFAGLQDRDSVRVDDDELVVATARGDVVVMTPGRFEALYPGARLAAGAASGCFAGFRVRVEDLARARAILDGEGIPHQARDGSLRIWPQRAHGVLIEIEESEPPDD
ncbi:MAG: VOC family protein [Ectothiorhodospiraceae bacterium]|nr:VOC family protein [Ectothiorhodospiraceae bacterium]